MSNSTHYHNLAFKFIKDKYGSPPTLRYYRQDWWVWSQGRYRVQSDDNMTARMSAWLTEEKEDSRVASIRELRNAVRSLPHVSVEDSLDMPLYIDIDSYDNVSNYLAFKDCLIDLDVLSGGHKPTRLSPNPRWFSSVVMGYNYNPNAGCPLLHTFLNNVVPDKVTQDVLQEWFGYCLTMDTSFRTMLILYGEARTGKSTLSNILEAMIGSENRSAVPLECFWNRFAPQEMVGKLVNFCGDSNKIDRLAEGVIKRFTGGDSILVDRKYKQPVTLKMTAKIVVATNIFPLVQDTSEALWDRFIVIPMNVRLKDNEIDRSLLHSEKTSWPLRRELPGIFNWAIEGLQRLRRQGHFTVSQRLLRAKSEVRHENCSVSRFAEERCSEGGSTTTKQFMHEYICFCENQALQVMDARVVGKILQKLIPGIVKRQLKEGGQRQMTYIGVTVNVPR